MACQIVRDKVGDVKQVRAANGKDSLAYRSLLTKVEGIKDTKSLRDRFASWEGKYIMPITNKRELALALYKQLYSPAFKSWMGDWTAFSKISRTDPGNEYRFNELRKTVRTGLLDENGEPRGEALYKVIQGPQGNVFAQVKGSTQPSPASPATLKKVKEFIDRLGV